MFGSRCSSGTVVGAILLATLALSGCGRSASSPNRDSGLAGGGSAGSSSGTGGTPASGGATSTGAGGAAGGGSGGSMVSGGTTGTGGSPAKGGTAGTATGGAPGTGGLAGKDGGVDAGTGGGADGGGAPGKGGTAGNLTGGSRTGGTTSTGTRNGGATGTGGGVGGRTGAGGAGGGTSAAVFQPLSDAFCKAAKTCCALDSFPAADLADCDAKFLSRLSSYAALGKGTVTLDQTALAACVAAYTEAATTCTITKVYAACTGVFAGALATGQACGSGSQFGSNECKQVGGAAACLWNSSTDAAGVCTEVPHGKNGEECGGNCSKTESCIVDVFGGPSLTPTCFETDGLYCATILDPPVCKPIRQLDQACTSDRNACGTGYYCDWTTNTCQLAKKLGESCKQATCPDNLMCDGTNCVELPFASDYLCKGTPPVPY